MRDDKDQEKYLLSAQDQEKLECVYVKESKSDCITKKYEKNNKKLKLPGQYYSNIYKIYTRIE